MIVWILRGCVKETCVYGEIVILKTFFFVRLFSDVMDSSIWVLDSRARLEIDTDQTTRKTMSALFLSSLSCEARLCLTRSATTLYLILSRFQHCAGIFTKTCLLPLVSVLNLLCCWYEVSEYRLRRLGSFKSGLDYHVIPNLKWNEDLAS